MATQPQQPQQQPVDVYPNTVTKQSPTSHSNGSFGTVFIVLAVILVISAIACCLGRLCNRRQTKQKPAKSNQQNHNFRPKERETDVEFGFDKGFPTDRPVGNGDPRAHRPSENDRAHVHFAFPGNGRRPNGHFEVETNSGILSEQKVSPGP
ncbi:hypothetical protein K2173_003198 [Erythroxylum novogranatense]|uniref:Transmembrane protein n=1 Tax=Erythroxylum novogranatense TaxID=1862640 RepID=A0AAV8SY54_9ROSI|nr:hypothetical protein K2173_003198 [Erythroxylum novogranatense]